MTSALIVGGAGFVGSHLARRLVGRGVAVHVAARRGSDLTRLSALGEAVRAHVFDGGDLGAAARCLAEAQPETIYFLASATRPLDRAPVLDALARATGAAGGSRLMTIVAAAATARRPPAAFVRAASLAEYGDAPAPYREEDRERPVTPYGAEMAGATHMLNAVRRSLPFRVVNARLALVYGPGQSTEFLIPRMIERLLAGEEVVIRNPQARRDLIDVDDAIDALELLSVRDIGAVDAINICTGVPVAMGEAAKSVAEAVGASASLIRHAGDRVDDGAQDLWGSPELAAKLLGWRAKVPFEDGVRRVVALARASRKARGS